MHHTPHTLRSSLLLVLLTIAALAATPRAQGCLFLPDADPSTGAGSTSPFGGDDPNDLNLANQCLLFKVPAAQLPAQRTSICALGFAAEASRLRHFDTLQIRLGHAQNTQLQTLFSANMPGFTALVVGAQNHNWQTTADQWTFIGLDTSFTYDPALGDLVVQIIVAGATSSGTGPLGFHSDPTTPSVLQQAWRFQVGRGVIGTGAPKIRVCWDAHDLQTFGGGCPGSNGQVPQLLLTGSSALGAQTTVSLRNAPATSAGAVAMFGYRRRAQPLDLTGFGAPGCELYTFFDFDVPTAISNGSFDLPLTVPNNSNLVGARLWPQWVVLDQPANPLGFIASSFGRILLGH